MSLEWPSPDMLATALLRVLRLVDPLPTWTASLFILPNELKTDRWSFNFLKKLLKFEIFKETE